jgi:hypothetical protein
MLNYAYKTPANKGTLTRSHMGPIELQDASAPSQFEYGGQKRTLRNWDAACVSHRITSNYIVSITNYITFASRVHRKAMAKAENGDWRCAEVLIRAYGWSHIALCVAHAHTWDKLTASQPLSAATEVVAASIDSGSHFR